MAALAPLQTEEVAARAQSIFEAQRQAIYCRTDRMFAALMATQWAGAILVACCLSPRTWAGTESAVHPHVFAAIFLGGLLSIFPICLALLRPGQAITRQVIAVSQLLMSALLIHLSGGRIATHFHIFGSLAFLAFYRDWRVLLSATIVTATDHFVRGLFWPQSVYGLASRRPVADRRTCRLGPVHRYVSPDFLPAKPAGRCPRLVCGKPSLRWLKRS